MMTKDCTPEEIKAHTAYFKDLQPNSLDFLQREGVPAGAYEMIAAKKIFLVAASARDEAGASSKPAIDIPSGVSVFICEVPPGNGPAMHAHMRTRETFMCLKGRFKITYGKSDDNTLELGPMDTVSVPDGVLRKFENVTDENAYLLVLIHETEGETALNDVFIRPETGREIAEKYGEDAVRGLERIGNQFTADVPE